MIHHYVYETYSEDDGRRYIGCRSCHGLPQEDPYVGSHKDRSYHPTCKTILQEFPTREEALKFEIYLHELYDVGRNPEFANRAKQTSTKFDTTGCPGPALGKVMSDATKKKISDIVRGKVWWTDGKVDKHCKDCPGTEWRRGRANWSEKQRNRPQEVFQRIAAKNKGKRWWTNGQKEIKAKECPVGWAPGRISKTEESKVKVSQTLRGQKWWTNGVTETKSSSCPGPEWTRGRLRKI